ncbi:MAG TPA: hypothetical protein VFT55_05815 [Planctomycetota bacterium]|nr:hypothetical protein [Planctomycetota bacterium]
MAHGFGMGGSRKLDPYFGWRRSLVDGSDSLDMGPFRLAIDRDTIWLATAVPRETWRAFS